jgi:hypothetical protein
MATTIHFQMEVAGCPTLCQHCWAQGVPYGAMPTPDIAWVLDGVTRFFATMNIPCSVFPMHEVAAHPYAPHVFKLFQDAMGPGAYPLFEPLSTTGVPLTTRPDWREVLQTCRSLGTTTVFLAVHGADAVHDRVVHRTGAWEETLLAAARAQSFGLGVGSNVFLTKENVAQFDGMVDALKRHGVTQFSFEPSTYYPTGRGRRYEAIRPELHDLLPLVERVRALSPFSRDQWSNLEAHTETAYVREALAGEWQAHPRYVGDVRNLVCRPNLDVYSGFAGLYRQRHGNARNDGLEAVLYRALEYGASSDDVLWFGGDPLPSVEELAAQYGDADGQHIHFTSESMRFRWLDLARQARKKLN